MGKGGKNAKTGVAISTSARMTFSTEPSSCMKFLTTPNSESSKTSMGNTSGGSSLFMIDTGNDCRRRVVVVML